MAIQEQRRELSLKRGQESTASRRTHPECAPRIVRQALQLIYAGREPLLKERNILKVLHRLFQKGLMGQDDYGILSDNYRYLRTLEHRLQQVNDLQTHTLPVGDSELEVLGRKMGYSSKTQFTDDLEKRRTQVRTIYDSLFTARNEEPSKGHMLFDEEFSDSELKEFLSGAGLRDAKRPGETSGRSGTAPSTSRH